MTLSQIVATALDQLGHSNDALTLGEWSEKFSQLANEALLDIANRLKLRRTDPAVVSDTGELSIDQLPNECTKVLSIWQGNRLIPFGRGRTTFTIQVDATGEVEVEYRYVPPIMANETDEPGIPERLHSLIVTYICAREWTSTDEQNRSNPFYELYNSGLVRAQQTYGEPETYKIYNKYGV